MDNHLSRSGILQQLNDRYAGSVVLKQADEAQGQSPVKALGCYIAAVVYDLYGDDSSDTANIERIAHALEVGSETLERLAKRLREG